MPLSLPLVANHRILMQLRWLSSNRLLAAVVEVAVPQYRPPLRPENVDHVADEANVVRTRVRRSTRGAGPARLGFRRGMRENAHGHAAEQREKGLVHGRDILHLAEVDQKHEGKRFSDEQIAFAFGRAGWPVGRPFPKPVTNWASKNRCFTACVPRCSRHGSRPSWSRGPQRLGNLPLPDQQRSAGAEHRGLVAGVVVGAVGHRPGQCEAAAAISEGVLKECWKWREPKACFARNMRHEHGRHASSRSRPAAGRPGHLEGPGRAVARRVAAGARKAVWHQTRPMTVARPAYATCRPACSPQEPALP